MSHVRSLAVRLLAARRSAASVAAAVVLLAAMPLAGQQVADSAFTPRPWAPQWPPGAGPRVALDEAHHNFHALGGRYFAFGKVLAADGFRVRPLREPFTLAALDSVDVLVVANALHASNDGVDGWRLPTPSAFTPAEVEAVRSWVEGGGALLLVADHMPFPGAAGALAAAFGFELRNGYAVKRGREPSGPFVFRRSDGSLSDHAVTRGVRPDMRVASVATFTGEAFSAPPGAASLLTLPVGTESLEPDTAWVFHRSTPRRDASGWSQGAVSHVGRGRVAVFGEAAMFSAQLDGPGRTPMGMNMAVAADNPRFLVNLVRWLAGAGGEP